MPTKRSTRAKRTSKAVAVRGDLTDKQRLFIEAYFANELNGAKAPIPLDERDTPDLSRTERAA